MKFPDSSPRDHGAPLIEIWKRRDGHWEWRASMDSVMYQQPLTGEEAVKKLKATVENYSE